MLVVVNMSNAPADLKLVNEQGQIDFAHAMPKRQVELPEGFTLDANWAAANPKIKIIRSEDTE